MTGRFITFEGGEGTGKSTQIALLAERLRRAGHVVVTLREPGGTAVGEAVRAVVLDTEHVTMNPRAELLLYEAARAQLVDEVIVPALGRGEIVLCDRYRDSSTAYQGHARGLALDMVCALNHAATGGLVPDLTILLDIDPSVGLRRATKSTAADRLESEDLAFHERVREGFLAIAQGEPERVKVVDAALAPDEIAERVGALVDTLLSAGGEGE